MIRLKYLFSLLALLMIVAISATTVYAHSRVEVGPYLLILGWVEEPVIVGERNALLLEVSEGDAPVTGLEGTVEIEIVYGGRTFIGNIQPSGNAGIYHIPLFPTVRGQYEVQLSGAIQDTPLDITMQPEEVLSASTLQFPQVEPDTIALAETVEELEADIKSAQRFAMGGIIAGILGTLLATFAIIKQKSK